MLLCVGVGVLKSLNMKNHLTASWLLSHTPLPPLITHTLTYSHKYVGLSIFVTLKEKMILGRL